MSQNLQAKVKSATKWSALTEILMKIIAPIVNMILARLLTPEAFGIVTTLTMVITFAEIFTDAGFQKYLIQHEFKDEKDKDESTNVAFWSNFAMSMLIWGVIALFCDSIASIVGNPGYGYVLVIACAAIPLAAFSSIQMALYRRLFDYKTLFKIRMLGILVPIIVTIPLAFILRSFWALVIGTLFQNIANAVMLTVFSKWKPRIFFSMKKLKEMCSFTLWSLVEAVSIWLTTYVDVFIVGTMLSQHYLGLYKTSSTLVGQIMGLVTSTTTPILFSSLSRLQNDTDGFKTMFFKFQKMVGMLVIPLGVGIYCYSDFVTSVVLGDQWMETADFVGMWGLTSSVTIVLSHYSSEVYRAKGKPKLSVISQWLHIIVLWPTVLFTVQYGYDALCLARSLVRLELILVNLLIMYFVFKYSIIKMFLNIMPSMIASTFMLLVLLLPKPKDIYISILYMLLASILYFIVLIIFPKERNICFNAKSILKK